MDTYNKASGYFVRYDPKRKYVVTSHQLKIEKKIGRKLKRGEIVHHINGNRSDCHLNNLKLVSRSKHNKEHHVWQGKKNPAVTMSHKERSQISKLGWKHRRKNE
jgi:hypothetical protein